MTSDPEARERSLSTLVHWKPGQSGNPKGRPSVGIGYETWANELDIHDEQGVAKYDDDALEAIVVDRLQCRAKRAAAAELLDMPRRDYHKAVPLRANAIDRLCDRTKGKPHQSMHVITTTTRPPAVISADKPALLLQAFASLPPAERQAMLKQMQEAVPALPDAEPIDQA